MKKRLTPGQIDRCFGVILAIFLAFAGFLYWQGYIQGSGFLLTAIVVLLAGAFCVFNTRRAQKDGFLNGYARAKDDFEKKKKG
ncbi:MAG: hypothetical protein ACOZBZ_04370 [Patescibacteria group bacterium]